MPFMDFWKWSFMQCVTALSEWKHPAKIEIWKCSVNKVIVSQMKESTLNHWNESFLKPIPVWHQHETLAYFPPLNENANSLSSTRCCFWGGKNTVFPGNAVHKVALLNTALSGITGEMRMRPIDQSEQIRVTQRSGLEKWIVERIVWESLCK